MSGLQFQAELVRKITRGEKTQTRRPVKRDQPARWKPTRTYAVQPGRGKPAVCRIEIIDVRQELVGDITLKDARAEGFRTTDEFKTAWVRIHDKAWLERVDEAMEMDSAELDEPFDVIAVARFEQRHAQKPVWVLTFRLDDTHTPRLLAAGWPDYTTSSHLAMRGEPEAITEADQDIITKRAGETFPHWHALEEGHRERYRQLVSVDARLAAAQRQARLQNIDVSREVWLVERLRQQGRTDPAVLHRVRGVERKIDRFAA